MQVNTYSNNYNKYSENFNKKFTVEDATKQQFIVERY